ncbi:MAG: phosphoesterase [Thermoprotei archaeon]|nr:MAG: phosphoesterase [Thermoprotei archaeon]
MNLIITHGDVDGVTSAALALSIYPDSQIFFSHPVGLFSDLKGLGSDFEKILILDIALNEVHLNGLLKLFEEYSKNTEITYIDHHPPPLSIKLYELPIEVFHEEDVCTAELTFRYFSDRIDPSMSRVALYGAIGDYALDTPFVREQLKVWDIRALFFEAGLLSQGLEGSRKMYDFKREVVLHLSRNRLPSELSPLLIRALIQSLKDEEMRRSLPQLVKTHGEIAYVLNPSGSLGRAAFYAYVLTSKRVGVAGEVREKKIVMSLRTADPYIDLNNILRIIMPQLGGSGGGHKKAAGARVPVDNFEEFLEKLNQYILRVRRNES